MHLCEIIWKVGDGAAVAHFARIPCIGECIESQDGRLCPRYRFARVVSVLHFHRSAGESGATQARLFVEQYDPAP